MELDHPLEETHLSLDDVQELLAQRRSRVSSVMTAVALGWDLRCQSVWTPICYVNRSFVATAVV